MSTVYVWRYEDSWGSGPYRGPVTAILADESTERHPMAYREIAGHAQCSENLRDLYASQRSGFLTPRQAKEWFCWRERRRMREHGFYLTRYLVPADAVIATPTQCLFRPLAAIAVKRYAC